MLTVERITGCEILLDQVEFVLRYYLIHILHQVVLPKPDIEHSWRNFDMVL